MFFIDVISLPWGPPDLGKKWGSLLLGNLIIRIRKRVKITRQATVTGHMTFSILRHFHVLNGSITLLRVCLGCRPRPACSLAIQHYWFIFIIFVQYLVLRSTQKVPLLLASLTNRYTFRVVISSLRSHFASLKQTYLLPSSPPKCVEVGTPEILF